MMGGASTFIPLKVNMAGVMPMIFASSFMLFPPTLTQFIHTGVTDWITKALGPNSGPYILGEVVLIILFTYFYTAVTFNPIDQADNLKKYGGFVPGIRPGRPTAEYLDRILTRITLPGALFLAAIAVLPWLLFRFTGRAVLLRRHVHPDRRGRGARHHAADGGAAAHAPLRGLPEMSERDGIPRRGLSEAA